MPAVSVLFVDAETGQTVGPAFDAPAGFEPAATVEVAGQSWAVERAEYVSDSRLVVAIRKIDPIPLFCLPSLADERPSTGPGHSREPCLELHEDDWRQVEVVSRAMAGRVADELAEIEGIYSAHCRRDGNGRVAGFSRIHLRTILSLPEPVPWPGRDTGEVRLGGAPVANSFAHHLGGAWCYGVTGPSGATVVGLHPAAAPVAASLRPLLREHDLFVVDWNRRTVH